MGKRTRQKRGAKQVFPTSYNASLIHGHRGVDRRFPNGLRAEDGSFVIFPYSMGSRNQAAKNTDPVPDTQRHGKRGLTMDRAEGPVEVAKHRQTEVGIIYSKDHISNPTVIPRAVVERRLEMEQHPRVVAFALWQGLRAQGITEYHRQVVYDHGFRRLEYYFSGNKHFYLKVEKEDEYISSIQTSRALLETKRKAGLLLWDGPFT